MKRRRRKTHELEPTAEHDRPSPIAAEHAERDQDPAPDLVYRLQTGLGNAAFGRMLASNPASLAPSAQTLSTGTPLNRLSLMRSLRGDTLLARQPASIQREPVDAPEAPPTAIPKAEDLIAAKYPQFVKAMTPEHYKAIDDMIAWRLSNEKLNQEIQNFDQREREKQEKEGWAAPGSNSYRFTSDYQDRLRRLQNKQKDPPPVGHIEIDTSKLIDPAIGEAQKGNIMA
ncbi:MAG TPA: hypothetical protein VG845_06340, partial [Dehalococcoidia bacterium]|nr:hypothetical protein [Dehalococcoidia bacterium]